MNKIAIITGVTGQDGSYLAEFLLNKDYQVIGTTRRKSTNADSWGYLEPLRTNKRFSLIYGDINDSTFINKLIIDHEPDELYLLAAQSHVAYSFKNPVDTSVTNAISTIYWLEAIEKYCKKDTRIYFAATSEMFGGLNCPIDGYNESSLFNPRSPYACAKLFSYNLINNYREAYGTRACSGILFNHSSPRRGLDFVERKITHNIAKIKLGYSKKITLGNLDAYRDLGHSKDYVCAQWLMLQKSVMNNFVIAMNDSHQIKEIVSVVANYAQLPYEDIVEYDSNLLRPSEVPYLKGDATLAREKLFWKPTYNFYTLLEEMYKNDYDLLINK